MALGTVASPVLLHREDSHASRERWSIEAVLDTPLCRVALTVGLVTTLALGMLYAAVGDWNGQDLDVYRAGGAAVLHGHSLYDASFRTPTKLPFTYPPFAAALFVPLCLIGQSVALALWNLLTMLAAGLLLVISFVSASNVSIARRWLPHFVVFGGVLAASLSPIQDGMYEGQVGVFLALLCAADVALPRTRWRRGILVGLAAALKMTPGLFIVYFAITRNWRAARASLFTLVVCWGFAAIVLPHDSLAYFVKGTAYDASRVGKASDHLNESLNGLWHRLPVVAPTAFWLISAGVIGMLGLWRAKRAHEMGNDLAAVVIVGLTTVLIAPVSWLHHAAWVIPAVVVLVWGGQRRAVAWAAALVVVGLLAVPVGYFVGYSASARGPLVEIYIVIFLALVLLLPLSRSTWRTRDRIADS